MVSPFSLSPFYDFFFIKNILVIRETKNLFVIAVVLFTAAQVLEGCLLYSSLSMNIC